MLRNILYLVSLFQSCLKFSCMVAVSDAVDCKFWVNIVFGQLTWALTEMKASCKLVKTYDLYIKSFFYFVGLLFLILFIVTDLVSAGVFAFWQHTCLFHNKEFGSSLWIWKPGFGRREQHTNHLNRRRMVHVS